MADMTTIGRLFEAIRSGETAVVSAMLSAEPELAAARNDAGLSAVTWACYTRQADPLAAVLAAGPPLDVFEAVAAGCDARALELLSARPELARAVAPDGFTPLHLAAFFSRGALAAALLERGADPAAVAANASRVTPLHSAAAARALDIARALLAAGAPADARQAGGFTALMSAAQQGDESLAGLLLEHGADPRLRADDGRSAADMADERTHHALAARLRAGRPE